MKTKKMSTKADRSRPEATLSDEALHVAESFDRLNEMQADAILKVMHTFESPEPKTIH